MNKAILSGSEIKVKDALNKHGQIIIERLRKHINDEDEILYRITFEVFTPKELDELEKRIQEGVKQHQANAEPGSPSDNGKDNSDEK